ncbi:MAG TPA: hypothetical protein VGS12_18210 [Caulobacteraceae bacterium]|nr:hypothetical protein [Caulobacteraceae bacterium]
MAGAEGDPQMTPIARRTEAGVQGYPQMNADGRRWMVETSPCRRLPPVK